MKLSEAWTRKSTIHMVRPPYESLTVVHDKWPLPTDRGPAGEVVVWRLSDRTTSMTDQRFVSARPRGIPLLVLLPAPDRLSSVAEHLRSLTTLKPAGVLPYTEVPLRIAVEGVIENSLQDGLGRVVTRYMVNRGMRFDVRLQDDVARIFELAPEVRSVAQLATRMFASRRTLGRRFAAAKLPVPSHLLQFARLLHVGLRIQKDRATIFRIACHYGYSDGFTMSNQMSRLIGCRPSEVRERLGWEWLVERWLQREGY